MLNGHGHVMARYRKRGSLTQYLAGTGGGVRYTVLRDARLAFARSDMTGALRLDLSPGRADLEFRAVNGRRFDQSAATCRDSVSPAGR